jgi:hypothetical protein
MILYLQVWSGYYLRVLSARFITDTADSSTCGASMAGFMRYGSEAVGDVKRANTDGSTLPVRVMRFPEGLLRVNEVGTI